MNNKLRLVKYLSILYLRDICLLLLRYMTLSISDLADRLENLLRGNGGEFIPDSGQYWPDPDIDVPYIDSDGLNTDRDGPNPNGDGSDPNGDGSDPNGDGSDPDGGGFDPDGGGSDPGKDGPDYDYKSSYEGKGKGRAITPEEFEEYKGYEGKGKGRAITPEFPEEFELPKLSEEPAEPSTDLEENPEDADFQKARFNSLKESHYKGPSQKGESSKYVGESSKHTEKGEHLISPDEKEEHLLSSDEKGEDLLSPDEQANRKLSLYNDINKARMEAIRAFNDIIDKIDREGDSMDERDKEFLLNESINIRKAVDNYTSHAQNLKDELNLNSEEANSEQYSSGEDWSEDYSDEESRPKKTDDSDEESRPSKRPRN